MGLLHPVIGRAAPCFRAGPFTPEPSRCLFDLINIFFGGGCRFFPVAVPRGSAVRSALPPPPPPPRSAEVEMEADAEKSSPGSPKTQRSAEKCAPGIAGAALSSVRRCRSRRAAPGGCYKTRPNAARCPNPLPVSPPPPPPARRVPQRCGVCAGCEMREALPGGCRCSVLRSGLGFFPPLRFQERSSLGCKTLRGGSAGTEGFAFLEAAHGKYAAMRRRRKAEGKLPRPGQVLAGLRSSERAASDPCVAVGVPAGGMGSSPERERWVGDFVLVL